MVVEHTHIRKVELREASTEIQLNTEFPANQGKRTEHPNKECGQVVMNNLMVLGDWIILMFI